MKRFVLLLLCFSVGLGAIADRITEQQALRKAQQFMKGKQFKQKNLRRAVSVEADNNAYYVFNVENNGGFVIVSGDDRTTEILGYSDKGTLDLNTAPPNLKWLLNYYQHVIDSVSKSPNRTRSERVTPLHRDEIAPLVQTQWGQNEPYNNLCPTINGNKCITGCVATAMAQTINYYKYPLEPTGAIEGYTTEEESLSMPPLAPTTFDWENMTNNDIARLMLYCGQSVKMDYGINASGADLSQPGTMESAFVDIFGYSKSMQSLNRELEYYDDNLWESVLYDELSANRIILYQGISWSAPGHLWIVDGYRDGFFHMNWGWDGVFDGYYKLSGIALDELISIYDLNNVAYIGIMPPSSDGNDSPALYTKWINYHYEVSIHSKGYWSRENTTEDFPSFSVNSTIYSDVACTMQIGFGLEDNEGNIYCLAADQHSFNANEEYYFEKPVTISSNYGNGHYRLVPIFRKDESGDWKLLMGHSTNYIEIDIEEQLLTTHHMPDGTHSKMYEEIGVKDIDGITYILYKDYSDDNYLADVLPKQVTGKYSGDIVIPNKVVYEGNTYRVFYANNENAFRCCEDLTSISFANASIENIWDCPQLTKLELQEGVTRLTHIGKVPLIEELVLPSTLIDGNFIGEGCINLKTIRFKGTIFGFVQDVPDWDENNLPALTDVYFPCTTPPQIRDQYTNMPKADLVPANTNARIHIPVGSLQAYKQSNWKEWTFVEDLPAPTAVTWGYCHGDVVTGMGSGVTSRSNYVEYAMRVPAEEMNVYKGSMITEIQVFSPSAAANDYHLEDYEYVYITKRGTDYIIKQPFNVVRGTWNTIHLETPYLITGEEIFVGVGRYKEIGLTYSDLTYVKDAAWGRAIGDDYGCIWEPGVWQNLGKDMAHPLPLRFTIDGDDTPEGVAVGELQIPTDNDSENAARRAASENAIRRAASEFQLQATIRNRSLSPVYSYEIEWFIDGKRDGSKTIESSIPANECEIIKLDLPAEVRSGNHVVSLAVKSVNNSTNELKDLPLPVIEIVGGQGGIIITAENETREYGEKNPDFKFTTKSDLYDKKPVLSCEATSESPVGTYPIIINKGDIENDNVSCINGTLTITKAPLTITAKEYTIKQGEPLPMFEAEYEGFKNNETSAVLTKQPTLSTTATSASAPGEYVINVSGAEAQNYEIAYVNGTLTITEASAILGISADNPMDIYDLQGNKVRYRATSLEGLPKGVYIINGRKVIVK